jgi:hypothetical protein
MLIFTTVGRGRLISICMFSFTHICTVNTSLKLGGGMLHPGLWRNGRLCGMLVDIPFPLTRCVTLSQSAASNF